jgi:hypothetical protein
MNTVKVLAEIGQNPKLKNTSGSQMRELLSGMFIPEQLLTPLLKNDKKALEEAGFKQDIVCFILSPAREREVPKDDHKPPEEDEVPYEKSSILQFG